MLILFPLQHILQTFPVFNKLSSSNVLSQFQNQQNETIIFFFIAFALKINSFEIHFLLNAKGKQRINNGIFIYQNKYKKTRVTATPVWFLFCSFVFLHKSENTFSKTKLFMNCDMCLHKCILVCVELLQFNKPEDKLHHILSIEKKIHEINGSDYTYNHDSLTESIHA